jgi:hypothetical protein
MRLLPPAVGMPASVLSEGLPVFPICTSATGQTENNSVRAYDFRFALELGHCSMQSALRICATKRHRKIRGRMLLVEKLHPRRESGVQIFGPTDTPGEIQRSTSPGSSKVILTGMRAARPRRIAGRILRGQQRELRARAALDPVDTTWLGRSQRISHVEPSQGL